MTPPTLSFTISGTLPGMNEMVAANRGNRFGGAAQKKAAHALIAPFLPRPIPLTYPVALHFHWFEPSNRRDPDNVTAAVKPILDAMVCAGVLAGDRRRHVRAISHEFGTDKDNPRVEVEVS